MYFLVLLWGFFAHEKINEVAVYHMPQPIFGFYKENLSTIIELSTLPDKRRYSVKDEKPKHYMDMENYSFLPLSYQEAQAHYGAEHIYKNGNAFWNIPVLYKQLIQAFKRKHYKRIVKISSELGHYLADISVPLHTTENYNGQLSGQDGVHALWETSLPKSFYEHYDFYLAKPVYIEDIQQHIKTHILKTHKEVAFALKTEQETTKKTR